MGGNDGNGGGNALSEKPETKREIEVAVSEIAITDKHRVCNPLAVDGLAESFSKMGQLNAIIIMRTVGSAPTEQPYTLLAGRHRLEAARLLGWETIRSTIIIKNDKVQARLQTISENLHREDLKALDRCEQMVEWTELNQATQTISGQHVPKSRGRPESGIAKAARDWPAAGKTEEARRKAMQRAMKIARISPRAKEKARAKKLDDSMSALLKIAEQEIDIMQEKKVDEIARRERRNVSKTKAHGVAPSAAKTTSSPVVTAPAPLTKGEAAKHNTRAERGPSDDQAFSMLTQAWALASEIARKRFVAEVVEPTGWRSAEH